MATYSIHPKSQYEHALLWTLGVSIGLHLLAMLVLPNIHIEKEPPEPALVIELAPAQKIAPPPVETPKPAEPPKPIVQEPVPPKPQTKPEPTIKTKSVATPSSEPPPQVQTAPEPVAPAVIAVAPKAEVVPVVTAPPPPPPEPAKPSGPSQADMDAARNQYGNTLTREIAKYKQYPKIAQMRGWQGDVVLELQIDSNGKVVSSRIQESSTFEALDKQAIEMAKKANFPPPPEVLRGHTFTVLVPVSFKLE